MKNILVIMLCLSVFQGFAQHHPCGDGKVNYGVQVKYEEGKDNEKVLLDFFRKNIVLPDSVKDHDYKFAVDIKINCKGEAYSFAFASAAGNRDKKGELTQKQFSPIVYAVVKKMHDWLPLKTDGTNASITITCWYEEGGIKKVQAF